VTGSNSREEEMMSWGNVPKGLVLGLVLVSLGVASCAGGGVGATLADMAKEVPVETTTFVYWDTGTIEGDADLHQLRDRWKADNEAWLETFAIETDRVRHFLHFATYGDNTLDHLLDFSIYGNNNLSVRGEFDRERLRTQLRHRDHTRGDWRETEIWQGPDEERWLALTGDSLIGGSRDTVRECIDIIEQDGDSLYSDPNARDILDRLPTGLMVHYYDYTKQFTGGPPYEGMVANGTSVEKKDRETLRLRIVCKFTDPEEAADALEAIRGRVDLVYQKVKAEQDGRFVSVTAEVETETFAI